jgi:hypothetical protein
MVTLLQPVMTTPLKSLRPSVFCRTFRFLIRFSATVMKYELRSFNSKCVPKKEPLGAKGQTLSQPRYQQEVIKDVVVLKFTNPMLL